MNARAADGVQISLHPVQPQPRGRAAAAGSGDQGGGWRLVSSHNQGQQVTRLSQGRNTPRQARGRPNQTQAANQVNSSRGQAAAVRELRCVPEKPSRDPNPGRGERRANPKT